MKIKIVDALNASEALAKLATTTLPVVTAFKVARLASVLKQPITNYDTARQALLRQVGKPDAENPEVFRIEDTATWTTELQKLLDHEIEVTDERFSLDDFGGANIEPKLLMQLGWCVNL